MEEKVNTLKISIIIPIYNKDKYLRDTLDSIIAQTFRDYECILIDDGSTDDSGKICDDVANRDARFKVFHIINGGVSHARNVGLEQAKGEYLTFIDGDDLIHPEYLNNLYICIFSRKVDLVISGYQKVWKDQRKPHVILPIFRDVVRFSDVLPTFASEQKSSGIYGCCVSKIFSRNLVSDIRFDDSVKLAEDFDFYLKLYQKIDTVFFDDKAYYYYLQEADNSSVVLQKDNIDYLAQFHICLHYMQMLQARVVWRGENQNIVEALLGNYAYFTLFYSSTDTIRNKFNELYNLIQTYHLKLSNKALYPKWLLFCLNHNNSWAVDISVRGYRLVRKIIRRS